MIKTHLIIPRGWGVWAGAIVLSVILHLSLFVERGSVAGQEKVVREQTTRVSFRSVAAPLTPPQPEAIVEEPPQPEPEVVEAPEPQPVPEARPKEPQKQSEKVRQAEPPRAATQPQPAPPSPASASSAEKQVVVVEQKAGSVADDPALLEQAKHEYLRRLMAHIESHKHYPRVARRRGIEGDVAVSFRLLVGGDISDLQVTEGHRVLRKAVKEAIAAAQPMPTPPVELELPLELSFVMQFSLRES